VRDTERAGQLERSRLLADPAEAGAPRVCYAHGVIRRATADDHPWITSVGALVYRELGDYDQVLPTWLVQAGVLAWVDADDRHVRRGFAILGFYFEDEDSRHRAVADLLAIGVDPSFQRRGIGQALLDHVIDVAARIGPANDIHELRLTVAHDNAVGQRLYHRRGFRFADIEPGRYAGGQQAMRMVRPLP
jgi:ribosomal protein S18 acetylase RimI-like enzyme